MGFGRSPVERLPQRRLFVEWAMQRVFARVCARVRVSVCTTELKGGGVCEFTTELIAPRHDTRDKKGRAREALWLMDGCFAIYIYMDGIGRFTL